MKTNKILISAVLLFALPGTANSAYVLFESTLDPTSANLEPGDDRGGVVEAGLNTYNDENILTWTVHAMEPNSSITAIHFHGPASSTQNFGDQVIVFEPLSPVTNTRWSDREILSDAQTSDLLVTGIPVAT